MTTSKLTSSLVALVIATTSTLGMAQAGSHDDPHDGRLTQPRQLAAHIPQQDARHSQASNKPAAHAAPTRNQASVQRGIGPQNRYHRGDPLPTALRSRDAVVHDWRSQQLSEPPRGHEWVKVGSDFALIAAASGVITQLVLDGMSSGG